jgi:hypothetical protein
LASASRSPVCLHTICGAREIREKQQDEQLGTIEAFGLHGVGKNAFAGTL